MQWVAEQCKSEENERKKNKMRCEGGRKMGCGVVLSCCNSVSSSSGDQRSLDGSGERDGTAGGTMPFDVEGLDKFREGDHRYRRRWHGAEAGGGWQSGRRRRALEAGVDWGLVIATPRSPPVTPNPLFSGLSLAKH